jgi:hypothetical protein
LEFWQLFQHRHLSNSSNSGWASHLGRPHIPCDCRASGRKQSGTFSWVLER